MKNCEKFNEIFIKAFNESIKTEAGQKICEDLAMFALCNVKTSKKAIKEIKDGFVEACFYNMLKNEKEIRNIFAECVRKDLAAQV